MGKGIVLILGAGSDIGIAIAYHFAKEGYDIQLAARNISDLEHDCSNIKILNNVNVTCHKFDALEFKTHQSFVNLLPSLPTVVVSTIGYMGNQKESQENIKSASLVMRSNFEGPASILGVFANHFKKNGSGIIVGISSVAGDRGRASNYIYGSAKAGFSEFLSGLRNRLSGTGAHVITIKPGFVFTKMTADFDLPKILTATPEEVASKVFEAIKKRKNVVYVKSIWKIIMLIISIIPEKIFKKTNF